MIMIIGFAAYLYFMNITDSSAYLCRFINKDEFHFLFSRPICSLYNQSIVTLQNAVQFRFKCA